MRDSEPYVPALRFAGLTPFYDALVAATTRERLFKGCLLEQAGIQSDWRVLDLGCGTGTLAVRAQQGQPAARIVGLDGDPQVLAIAKRKARGGGRAIGLVEGRSYRLPFEDASFDCALSSLFFHHLTPSQKTASLAEVWRVLKPGGHLHIADWGAAAGFVSRTLFRAVQQLDGVENTVDHVEGRFPQYMTRAGFEDVEIRASLWTMFGMLSLFRARRGR